MHEAGTRVCNLSQTAVEQVLDRVDADQPDIDAPPSHRALGGVGHTSRPSPPMPLIAQTRNLFRAARVAIHLLGEVTA
jgi:hypothetical protein